MSIMSKIIPVMAKRYSKLVDEIMYNPICQTESKLEEILKRNRNTAFGKDHRYESIKSPEQFAEQVPLYDYYSMSPYFDRVKENPAEPIVSADPVVWYVQSSGSTGKPKALPIMKAGMKDYSLGATICQLTFVNAAKDNNKMYDGTVLTFAAPSRLGEINGIPVGYMSGIIKDMVASRLLRRLMKPGDEVFNMTDVTEKLWSYAKYSVMNDITAMGGITTLSLSFIRKMQTEYGPALLKEFAGTKHEAKLRAAMNEEGIIDVHKLWPNLKMLVAAGIDADPYKEWVKRTLPTATLWDSYVGSEGFYGGTLLDNTDNGLQLMTNLNYFEFIPENEIHKDVPRVVPLSEIKKNHRYEIVISNLLGYTRYRVGDMMTFKDTDPYSVHRIGRKGRVVNLAGEKLTDAHVNEGVATACERTGALLSDYTVLGKIDGSRAYYIISAMFQNNIDMAEFGRAFDEAVGEKNGEFKHSLEFGALDPTMVVRMTTSHTENIIKNNHIQSKSLPLSMAEA